MEKLVANANLVSSQPITNVRKKLLVELESIKATEFVVQKESILIKKN